MSKNGVFWFLGYAVVVIFSFVVLAFTIKSGSSSVKVEKQSTQKVTNEKVDFKDISFPDNFFFGTAYSFFQVAGISSTSDWDYYIKNRPEALGNHAYKDSWDKFREDYRLAGKIGIQVHRLSLDWSSVEPEEGKFDLVHVKKLIDMIAYGQSQGVDTMICLNHFPLPKWFADKGGWENPEAPYDFEKYASFVAKNIGKPLKIKWWLTFNEPQFVISVPYAKGTWPPFKAIKDLEDTKGLRRLMQVTTHVLDSHRLAYRAIHEVLDRNIGHKEPVMVSFASAPGAFYPNDPNSPPDKIITNIFDVFHSQLIDVAAGMVDRDFIGLNCYGRYRLKFHISLAGQVLPWLTQDKPFSVEWNPPEKNGQGERPIEFYPDALYDMIMKFKPYGLPIVVTENGFNGDDRFREEFIVVHLKAVLNAIRDGANVIGYQYWSLADTWEPGDSGFGYSRMGLITSNPNAPTDASPREYKEINPSAWTYHDIIKTRVLSKELQEKHKELLP